MRLGHLELQCKYNYLCLDLGDVFSLVLSFIYTQIIRGSRPHFKKGGFTNIKHWWRTCDVIHNSPINLYPF